MFNNCFLKSCWPFSNVINDSLKQSSSGFVRFVLIIIWFHFLIGMGPLVSEFGMLDVLRVVFGIYWVFLHYFLDDILSFWGGHTLIIPVSGYGWLRVVPVYNFIFFDLINFPSSGTWALNGFS